MVHVLSVASGGVVSRNRPSPSLPFNLRFKLRPGSWSEKGLSIILLVPFRVSIVSNRGRLKMPYNWNLKA